MYSMARVPQTHAELEAHLQAHLGFLQRSADAYDSGFEDEAKRLAVSIRVLVHNTKSSQSLLTQLQRTSTMFYDTCPAFDPRNLATFQGLVALNLGTTKKYVAMLDRLPMKKIPKTDFMFWWNKVVFVDKDRNQLTRRDLVLSVADQDGGAHVDPALNETYASLSRLNSLGWMISEAGTQRPMPGPEHAAVRQIAHEVLKSLKPGYVKMPNSHDGAIFTAPSVRIVDDHG